MVTRFTHPGEVLREEFMAPRRIRAYTLAQLIGVSRTRIEHIVDETGPITADVALRLAHLFGTTPQFWLGMQQAYDLAVAEADIGQELAKIKTLGADDVEEVRPATTLQRNR